VLNLNKEEILETLKTGRVDYVRVEFVDILGNVRGKSLRRVEFQEAIEDGIPFSSSILSYDYKDRPLEESEFERDRDIIALPDPSTFIIIPYLERTGRVLSYIKTPDLTPHEGCSRTVLAKTINDLEEKGIKVIISLEPKFYLVRRIDNKIYPADSARAYSTEGFLAQQDLLKKINSYLESCGIPVEKVSKEKGPGQYEINFVRMEALKASDSMVALKEIVRDISMIHGLIATFMPMPFNELPSGGMHIHISLIDSKDKRNLFYDQNDQRGFNLSRIAYSFIAGILEHIEALTAITNPTVNSFKKFKADRESSKVLNYARGSRLSVIRIPEYKTNNIRIELRFPDALSNIYLALASIIRAGYDGIERDLDPGVIGGDGAKIDWDLEYTLKKLEDDKLLMNTLGEKIIREFIKLKKKEIQEYYSFITDWEVENYLKTGI